MEETPLISPDIDTTGFTKNLDDSVNSLQSLARKVDQLPLGIPDAPADNIYYGRINNAWTNLKTYFDLLYSALGHTHQAFPVGSVFISVVSTNPNTLLGYGTWSAFATGRTLVGIDAAQTEFNAIEKTGGEKAHTLTSTEMPAHSHVQDAHNHTQNSHNHAQDAHNHTQNAHNHAFNYRYGTNTTITGGATRVTNVQETNGATGTVVNTAVDNSTPTNVAATATNQSATATNQSATATNQNTGGGASHNNLQPYIVVYIWKRTA